jgi:hypothetical protein
VLLALHLFVALNRPSVTSRLKIPNRSFYHFGPVLWNSLPSSHAAQHSTSSPTPVSCIPDITTCLSKKTSISPLSHFLPSLVCTLLGYSWTDISGIYPYAIFPTLKFCSCYSKCFFISVSEEAEEVFHTVKTVSVESITDQVLKMRKTVCHHAISMKI